MNDEDYGYPDDYDADSLPCGCCSCCGCTCAEAFCPVCAPYYCDCEDEEE